MPSIRLSCKQSQTDSVQFLIAGADGYNVAVLVNHPAFVAWYVRDVVPEMVDLQQWPRPSMRPALCSYLLHHRTMLEEMSMWTPDVQHSCLWILLLLSFVCQSSMFLPGRIKWRFSCSLHNLATHTFARCLCSLGLAPIKGSASVFLCASLHDAQSQKFACADTLQSFSSRFCEPAMAPKIRM